MKNKNFSIVLLLALFVFTKLSIQAQGVPIANFTITPNPICTGAPFQIIDQSTGNPTSWSYSIITGFGPPQVYTTQNPTLTSNFAFTFTIAMMSINSSGNSTIITKTVTVLQGPNVIVNPANTNLCIGATNQVTITAVNGGGGPGGGQNTYSWSTGATNTVIIVSPSVSTVYTCVITATNGCSLSRTSTVTVTTPTAAINSVPVNICPGSTSTLTASGSGPGPWTYTWSNASTSTIVTSNVPGVFTTTMQNSAGCKAVTTYTLGSSNTLSMNIVSNPTTVCAGAVANIIGSGATSYTWSSSTTNNANFTVNPTSTAVYSVIGSVGTCTGSANYTLQVNNIPTITINSSGNSVCAGSTVTLTANGASIYTWTPGNLYTQSISPIVNNTTIYTARGINSGCPARTATIQITVMPAPVIGVISSSTSICAGELIAITATGANSYTWSTGFVGQVLLTTPTVTGVYSVTGVNANNCTNTATVNITADPCLGINNYTNGYSLNVYPNPSDGKISVEGNYLGKLNLINELGQIIKVIDFKNGSTQNIEGLSQGIYFLVNENKTIQKKIVILQ